MTRKTFYFEFTVGVFLLIGIACLAYLSIRLARKDLFSRSGYQVYALFSNISGLSSGSSVEIAGVEIGRVKSIALDDYNALIIMVLDHQIQLQSDVIASIKTKGLFGEKFVEIVPGAEEEFIPPDGRIRYTEPAMDIESLISKFVHGGL